MNRAHHDSASSGFPDYLQNLQTNEYGPYHVVSIHDCRVLAGDRLAKCHVTSNSKLRICVLYDVRRNLGRENPHTIIPLINYDYELPL